MNTTTNTVSALRAAGAILYGPAWQSELARKLGVADRTVRYWVAGGRPIPAGVWADIARLLEQHGDDLAEVTAAVAAVRP